MNCHSGQSDKIKWLSLTTGTFQKRSLLSIRVDKSGCFGVLLSPTLSAGAENHESLRDDCLQSIWLKLKRIQRYTHLVVKKS